MKIYLLLFMLPFLGSACTPSSAPQPLSPSPWAKIKPGGYNAAILVMDGVYNTELVAPMDIFHHTRFRDSIRAMNVFTVADDRRTITTFEGLCLIPDFNFTYDSLPPIDILIVPSAEHHLDSDLDNTRMIEWVKNTGATADFVLSLCDGAFVLAKAGLLDSVQCTTFPDDTRQLKKMFPQLNVVEGVSFVHDGKYITSAGGDRSFDAALYLCEHLYGKHIADRLAHGLVIDWNLQSIKHLAPGKEQR
jgi:transcriptional regulator GlxA family with amidase domain